jgi:hypothetical protein
MKNKANYDTLHGTTNPSRSENTDTKRHKEKITTTAEKEKSFFLMELLFFQFILRYINTNNKIQQKIAIVSRIFYTFFYLY